MNRLNIVLLARNKDDHPVVILNVETKFEVWVLKEENWQLVATTHMLGQAMDAINQGGKVYDAA